MKSRCEQEYRSLKMVNATPYNARVRAGGTPKFEAPLDSFMQVVPQTSVVIPNARSDHRIFDCSRRYAVSIRAPPMPHHTEVGVKGSGTWVLTHLRTKRCFTLSCFTLSQVHPAPAGNTDWRFAYTSPVASVHG